MPAALTRGGARGRHPAQDISTTDDHAPVSRDARRTSTSHEQALEAALQARWDADTAAVYADLLSARGDPRGELIAIDLELARRDDDDPQRFELRERKAEHVRAWLGDALLESYHWQPRDFARGLLRHITITAQSTATITDHFRCVLDSPIGNRIAGLTIYGTRGDLESVLDLIIARPLPWLRKLALHRYEGARRAQRPIDAARWRAAIAATPHVEQLSLLGPSVVATPIHPTVHTLRLDGDDAIAIGAATLPGVTTLDLFYGELITHARGIALAALPNPRTFPALRTLDLARNEGRLFAGAGALLDPFLGAIEAFERITRIRLPSVRDEASRDYVLGLLARHPALTIEIARTHTTFLDGVEHPRLHVPPHRVWPASAHGRDALSIGIPPHDYGEELALSSLIDDLEAQFDQMRPGAQRAWLAFWAFLEDLPWENDDTGSTVFKPYPAALMLEAVEALEGNRRADLVAAMIRDARLPAGASVTVSRYWGW